MNIIEESFQTKEKKKKNRVKTILLIAIIFTVIIIIGISIYLAYIQSRMLRLTLDGSLNDNLKDLLVIEEDGTVYLPIKQVASYFGYESFDGEYNAKSESINKCYAQSTNEAVNFTLGSNKIYKIDLSKNTSNYEYIYTRQPVKSINGQLYATSETISQAFNLSFTYDQENNRITIYTMPYLIQSYTPVVLDYGYSGISNVFANNKAILNSMLVVSRGSNSNQFGVIDLQGNTIIEAKYDNITYIPEIGDFLVTSNNKVGIISAKRETILEIAYDSIELMDKDAGLYIVRRDNKYGVVDIRGNTRIYIENDAIGIDISRFSENDIKNKYLLMDNLIPVQKDNKWGLYDVNGNQVVGFNYDSFGYIASNNRNAYNLLVIPSYNVLVACVDRKYTLINSSGEQLFEARADDIYMTIERNEKHYYISINDRSWNVEEYLNILGVQPVNNNTSGSTDSSNSGNTSLNSSNSSNLSNTSDSGNMSTVDNANSGNIEGNLTDSGSGNALEYVLE